jgi:cytochrome c-type biogenesis protein CcmF
MIQEKKGMLKIWNLVLIILTFGLSIFGTFLTRSGVLSSVHTFAQSSLGPLLLGFLGLTLVVAFGLLFFRLPALKSQHELDAVLSRESSFLVNNLLLVGIAFTTLWGTIFPLIAEAVRGVKVTVGPPFYNQVMIPFGLALLLITAVCPLIAWRRASWANLKRNFLTPLTFALVGTVSLAAFGIRRPLVLATFSLLFFVAATITLEFYRGSMARRQVVGGGFPRALGGLVWRNRRRYGGYIIHLGILLLVLAVAGGAFKVEREAYLKLGAEMEIGRYRLRYEEPVAFERGDLLVVGARIGVSNAGKPVTTLVPEKRLHAGSKQPHTMAAIWSTPKQDLYLILASIDKQGIAIRALINPFMMWMWIGAYVIGIGTLIVMWPERKGRRPALRGVREDALV